MKEFKAKLDTITKVKEFCNIANDFDGDIIAKSGIYTVDGKSILGLFSLNLMEPVIITVPDNSDISVFNDYIV